MSAASELLRPGLLAGIAIAVVGDGEAAVACREALGPLGAQLSGAAGAQQDALVLDASQAAGDGRARALSEAWACVHAYAGELIEAGRGGRILLIAPPDEAAAAALENLARTLSVEWARRGITVVALARGDATSAAKVAALVAFLCSQAGAYYSGCLLDLRGA